MAGVPPQLRAAVPGDARDLAALNVRAWWHAYRGFLGEERLLERDTAGQEARMRERLERPAGIETWVAVAGGRIAGYTRVGPGGDPDAVPGRGELHGLYVDPPAQGAGVGALLHEHALGRLRALGFTAATLWVFAENEQGRAFYEHRGWTEDPGGPGNEGCGWMAPSLRYRRAL